MYQPILLAVDGSHASLLVLHQAIGVGKAISAEVEALVEIHSTLKRCFRFYGPSARSCSANFELVVRLTLNYPRFGSRNSELSRVPGTP